MIRVRAAAARNISTAAAETYSGQMCAARDAAVEAYSGQMCAAQVAAVSELAIKVIGGLKASGGFFVFGKIVCLGRTGILVFDFWQNKYIFFNDF